MRCHYQVGNGQCVQQHGHDGAHTVQPHSEKVKDAINPQHYKSGGLEAIDVIEAFQLPFLTGNVIKYILRAGKKGDYLEDIRKALWYLNREVENEKKRREGTEIR
jgi:hypothetical protein